MDKIGDRVIIASTSGGKDSTAMCLHLMEIGVEFKPVFMNTGWEHPSTLDYLDKIERTIGPIHRIETEGMEAICRRKGMFPSRLIRFCTSELKVIPLRRYLDTLEDEPVNAVGVRAAESRARAELPEWEHWRAGDCEVWRPIIDWSLEDVVAVHQRHGIQPAPLYREGATRLGCWPCIFARKSEIKMLADIDTERIDTIRALESELTQALMDDPARVAKMEGKAKTRAAAAGTSYSNELRRMSSRTFFHGKAAGTGRRAQESTDIDSVVAWSRTSRGGRQYPLFDSDEPAACFRWGLCDTEGET